VTTAPTPIPPPPPASAPHNFAPVLRVSDGIISWTPDRGAYAFHGAISTDARGTSDRTTTYTDLDLATSWKPASPPCGHILYYGVASEGNAGEQWTAREVAIAGPVCPKPSLLNAPTITGTLKDVQTLTLHPGTWLGSTSQTESWERCPVGQTTSCQPITPSATNTYFTNDFDVYYSMAVVETAAGPGGTSRVTVETGEIIPPPPTLDFRDTHPPQIASSSPGQATPGETISLAQGGWAWADGGLTDVWVKCLSATMCEPVSPQPTGLDYVVQSSDVGFFIEVVETAHGQGGTTTATTLPTISIVNGP
jgi:hypothetical protein